MSFISTENLHISIAKKTICQPLNLQIEAGQVWGVLGGNGSGKTTLLHTLAGLHKQYSGKIILNNLDLRDYTRAQLAYHIGVLFQQQQDSFPSTVLETALIGRHPHIHSWFNESAIDRELAQKVLAEMNLIELQDRQVNSLSGGERQRLAIATVLLQTPALYILDEPANHLDLRYQVKIFQKIQNLARAGAAVLMSLQDLNHASRYCTHIILIFEQGEVMFGKVEEILKAEMLTRLYQQAVISVNTSNGVCWVAC